MFCIWIDSARLLDVKNYEYVQVNRSNTIFGKLLQTRKPTQGIINTSGWKQFLSDFCGRYSKRKAVRTYINYSCLLFCQMRSRTEVLTNFGEKSKYEKKKAFLTWSILLKAILGFLYKEILKFCIQFNALSMYRYKATGESGKACQPQKSQSIWKKKNVLKCHPQFWELLDSHILNFLNLHEDFKTITLLDRCFWMFKLVALTEQNTY